MDKTAKRLAALKAARDIVETAQKAVRGLTADEKTEIEGHLAEADRLEAEIKAAAEDAALLTRIGGMFGEQKHGGESTGSGTPVIEAKSLGEFFAKTVDRDGLARIKQGLPGVTVGTPEFKAATDTHATPAAFQTDVLQTVDTSFVRPFRRALVTDLFGTGQISGTSVKYYIEAPIEGTPTTVAEGGQKPQIHLGDPTSRTDEVKKIAAWWDMNDEMVEDLPFWVSEINSRGLRLLAEVEEQQILNGDGVGSNLLGVLNREGVQTVAALTTAADTIYAAMTAVQSVTGLSADGLVIHPEDYQTLRLNKDGNGQYFGGGYFQNAYGNSGGIMWQPDVWGLKTVVSTAAPKGSPVVGAFKAAATVYRKGGVRVESTNSDRDKFTRDIVTTRIEERLALAVRYPSAIAKVTLPAAPAA